MKTHLIYSLPDIPTLQNFLSRASILAFDVESTGLDFINDTLLMLQLFNGEDVCIIDCRKFTQRELTYIVNLIQCCDATKVAHNAKFDLKFLGYKSGVLLENVYCTMIAETILNGGKGGRRSLANLVRKYLNIELVKDIRETFIDFDGEFTQEQIEYGVDDVIYLPVIYASQYEQFHKEKMLEVMKLEMRLVTVVASMEIAGITLDRHAWQIIVDKTEEEHTQASVSLKEFLWVRILDKCRDKSLLEVLEFLRVPVKTKRDKKFLSEFGITESVETFERFLEWYNPASWNQVLGAFDLLGIPLTATNDKVITNYKLYNTNDDEHIDFIDLLLNFRELEKKLTSYGNSYIEKINRTTGRIHADFNQIGTRTGRFSCNTPNLQQVPATEEYRSAFLAGEDYYLVTVDYSQQEYRLAGELSGEKKIIDAYLNGLDMHTLTGCMLFGVSVDELTKEQRNIGKTINFAILYGTSQYGLAKNLKISVKKAEELISKFKTSYPILTKFIEEVHSIILERYYSVTPLGRKRYFDKKTHFDSPEQYQRYIGMIKREGFNHPIQGGSADMLKLGMIHIYYDNPFGFKLLRTLLAVHDEVVVEVHESILDEGVEFIMNCMEKAGKTFQKQIPVKAGKIILRHWSK